MSVSNMRLLSLFLYNPAIPTDECNAHENILCYHPPDTPIDDQMNDAGFCVALLRLQESFGVPPPWDELDNVPPASPTSSPRPRGDRSCSHRSSADANDENDRKMRYRVRTITLSKRRFTIIPLESQVILCVVTNRETLKPNISATGESPMVMLSRSIATSVHPQQRVSVSEKLASPPPSLGPPGTTTGVPPLSPSPRRGDVGQRGASSPYWHVPSTIAHASDDIDESIIEVLTRLGETSHRMFSMMFGSVQWNYELLCVLEREEHRGLVKRPSRRETEDDHSRSGGMNRHEYEEERGQQRKSLERVLREGFINRLVSAIAAASSAEHSLEGSFACPEGVEILPVSAEVHLMIGSLVAQLASAHPGAIRDTFVASGMKTAYSTLSVTDSTTLFYLMKYYNSVPASHGHTSASQRSCGSDSKTAKGRRHLRRSLQLDVANEFLDTADPTIPESEDAGISWYDPETNLRSEGRRSDFLRTMQHLARAEEEIDEVIPALSSSPVASSGSLPVADRVEFGFPFIFLGDNDPVGVFTRDIGNLRFMFLVNEKYLRITELRAAFEQSMAQSLHRSSIPLHLARSVAKGDAGTVVKAKERTGKDPIPQAPTAPSGGFLKQRSSLVPPKEAKHLSSPRLQSQVMESHYLYYYRSAAISQVRSSILQRIPSVAGSLVCPVMVSPSPTPAKTEQQQQRRSVLVRQLLSLTGGSENAEGNTDSNNGSQQPLTLEERECIYLMDCVRSDFLRGGSSQSSSTLMLVRKKVWVSVLSFGARDLSCVVVDKGSVEAAEAAVEVLSRLVFFYSFRSPGL